MFLEKVNSHVMEALKDRPQLEGSYHAKAIIGRTLLRLTGLLQSQFRGNMSQGVHPARTLNSEKRIIGPCQVCDAKTSFSPVHTEKEVTQHLPINTINVCILFGRYIKL